MQIEMQPIKSDGMPPKVWAKDLPKNVRRDHNKVKGKYTKST